MFYILTRNHHINCVSFKTGCYLRRLMVFFDKLTFSQVTTVFEAFKDYYKPCENEIKQRSRYRDKCDLESNMQEQANSSSMQHLTW